MRSLHNAVACTTAGSGCANSWQWSHYLNADRIFSMQEMHRIQFEVIQ